MSRATRIPVARVEDRRPGHVMSLVAGLAACGGQYDLASAALSEVIVAAASMPRPEGQRAN